jgi:hypothetical protein
LSPLSSAASRTVLVAPGEGAEEVIAFLTGLQETVELVPAEAVAGGDGPSVTAAAIAGYEAQGKRLAPAAAIVHGSGDRTLAAAISLAKLEVPLARVAPASDARAGRDLPALLADHTIEHDGALAEQVRDWLRRILTA